LVISTALLIECAYVASEYFIAISDILKTTTIAYRQLRASLDQVLPGINSPPGLSVFCDGNNQLVPLWKHCRNDWIPDFSDMHTDATNGILSATMPPVS
jgi:hypothetical protein